MLHFQSFDVELFIGQEYQLFPALSLFIDLLKLLNVGWEQVE